MKKRLGSNQEWLLREAVRRYRMFHANENPTAAWTGLGTATEYAPAVKAGYMECATGLNPGHLTWWRLTPEGAAIAAAIGAHYIMELTKWHTTPRTAPHTQ